MTATVSIVIGSESDLDLANKCSETLDSLSISNSIQIKNLEVQGYPSQKLKVYKH